MAKEKRNYLTGREVKAIANKYAYPIYIADDNDVIEV